MTDGEPRISPTVTKLLDAAVTVIAEHGYSRTTVDQIADAAGVAKGTVYYNFESKDALFESLLAFGIGRLTTTVSAAMAAEDEVGLGQLQVAMRAVISSCRADPAFARILITELFRVDRPWNASLAAAREQIVGLFSRAIDAAVAAGRMADTIDIRVTGWALFGASLVTAVEWLTFAADRPEVEIGDAVVALIPAIS